MSDEDITPSASGFGQVENKSKDKDVAEDNFFLKTPESSAAASNIMSEKAPKDYSKITDRDELNDKSVRKDPHGDNPANDELAPYRYLDNEDLARQMFEADKEQRQEVKNKDSIFGRIRAIVDELEGKDEDGNVTDEGPNLISNTTSQAVSHLNMAIRLLEERQVAAVTTTLLETGNDAAETERIREEFGAPPSDPAAK